MNDAAMESSSSLESGSFEMPCLYLQPSVLSIITPVSLDDDAPAGVICLDAKVSVTFEVRVLYPRSIVGALIQNIPIWNVQCCFNLQEFVVEEAQQESQRNEGTPDEVSETAIQECPN